MEESPFKDALSRIGQGSFGIIFSFAETQQEKKVEEDAMPMILKRTISLNNDLKNWLHNDACWHQRIEKAFNARRSTLVLPEVPAFVRYIPSKLSPSGNAKSNEASAATPFTRTPDTQAPPQQ